MFEYRIEDRKLPDEGITNDALVEWMNSFGKDGWELVSIDTSEGFLSTVWKRKG